MLEGFKELTIGPYSALDGCLITRWGYWLNLGFSNVSSLSNFFQKVYLILLLLVSELKPIMSTHLFIGVVHDGISYLFPISIMRIGQLLDSSVDFRYMRPALAVHKI